MVKVYFERRGYAELVAVFMDEQMYVESFNGLEETAKRLGFDMITEEIVWSVGLDREINMV
jgi:hypothetical protein